MENTVVKFYDTVEDISADPARIDRRIEKKIHYVRERSSRNKLNI